MDKFTNLIRHEMLYGTKLPDPRSMVRPIVVVDPLDSLAESVDAGHLAVRAKAWKALHQSARRAGREMVVLSDVIRVLMARAYAARMKKRPARHKPRRINGRLRPLARK